MYSTAMRRRRGLRYSPRDVAASVVAAAAADSVPGQHLPSIDAPTVLLYTYDPTLVMRRVGPVIQK